MPTKTRNKRARKRQDQARKVAQILLGMRKISIGIDMGSGSSATASAIIQGRSVVAVNILNSGSGYEIR